MTRSDPDEPNRTGRDPDPWGRDENWWQLATILSNTVEVSWSQPDRLEDARRDVEADG